MILKHRLKILLSVMLIVLVSTTLLNEVNINVHAQSEPTPTFYAPFDGNYDATTSDGGKVSSSITDDSYLGWNWIHGGGNWTVGMSGSAINMFHPPSPYGGPDIYYSSPLNYIDRTQGTIEFWLKLNWSVDQEQENGYTWPFSMGYIDGDAGLKQTPCTFSVLLYGGYLTFFTYNSTYVATTTQDNTDGTNGTTANVNYWNDGEWHQVAFSWMYDPTGQNLTFTPYIDGEPWPEMNATGWDPGAGAGSLDYMVICRRATDAALDEFKIFNVALDGDMIKADYLNLCPVDYHAHETVFYTNQPGQEAHVTIKDDIGDFGSTLIGRFGIAVRGGKSSTTNTVLKYGETLDLTVSFNPVEVGEYYLDCFYAPPVPMPSGPQEENRTIRLFAIPSHKQPSKSEFDKLAFGNGIYIDCVSNKFNSTIVTNGPCPYYNTSDTCVGNYPSGYSYRMTGPIVGDRFGYAFGVPADELNKPFLVEVDYVALINSVNSSITMEIDILEPGHPAIQTGVYTGNEYPCNWVDENGRGLYKTQRIIFWPCNENNVISIVNRWKGHYADVVDITIVPIQGDDTNGWFPKISPVTPSDGGRLLGLWYEEPQIPVDFGAPNATIAGFYVALKHMIDYMHYTGQNLLSYPIYFYDDPLYPSSLEGWPVYGEKGIMHPDNWFELMLNMCALNGISVIGDLMISTIPSLQENIPWEWGPSEWPVETYTAIADGTGTALEHMTRELVQEVVHDYGGCPALIGLSIRVYEDYYPYPINTLLKKDSNRNLSELLWGNYPNGNVLDQLSNQKLIFPGFIPEVHAENLTIDTNSNLDSLYAGAGIPFDGVGGENVRDNSQIMFQRVLEFSWYRQNESDGMAGQEITRDYYDGNPSYLGNCYYYFTGSNENNAAVLYNAYWEPGVGEDTDVDNSWPSATCNLPFLVVESHAPEFGDELSHPGYWRYPAITPGYRYFMQDYSLAMANIDPLYIGNGGSTVGTVGHDVRIGDLPSDNNPACEDTVELYGLPIQSFAKSYRALPAETFTTFASLYRTKVRESPDNKYFYIQSQESTREKVTLTFNQKSDFHLVDLGDSSPGLPLWILVHQGTCTFELDPYQLESFSTDGTVWVTGEKCMTETVLQNDNAVVDVTPFKTVVGQGLTTNINVTAAVGVPAEPVNITLYANQTIIGTLTNVTLAYGNLTTITFPWNTTSFAKGNYTIGAYVRPVPEETDTTDNNCTGGLVCVSIIGDITGGNPNLLDFVPDGKVDMKDVGVVARHFGQNVPVAPSNCDITGPTQGVPDGKIDMRDIGLVARNFGQHYP